VRKATVLVNIYKGILVHLAVTARTKESKTATGTENAHDARGTEKRENAIEKRNGIEGNQQIETEVVAETESETGTETETETEKETEVAGTREE